jgi:hypothetical protein
MSACAEIAPGRPRGAGSSLSGATGLAERTLGPAMRLMLTLAEGRAHTDAASGTRQRIQSLWDLAERYHPEQAWLAASWLRNERTMDELERCAPKEGLAPGLRAQFDRITPRAQDLRAQPVFAQE